MRESYTQAEKDLVMSILELSEGTAHVDISFGYTDNSGQCRKGIVIKNCPHKILEFVMTSGAVTMLEEDGLHIVLVRQ